MGLFSRRTASATTSERELTAAARLGLAPWRTELQRVGLDAEEPVFVANNDGGSILSPPPPGGGRTGDRRRHADPLAGCLPAPCGRCDRLGGRGSGRGRRTARKGRLARSARWAGDVGARRRSGSLVRTLRADRHPPA